MYFKQLRYHTLLNLQRFLQVRTMLNKTELLSIKSIKKNKAVYENFRFIQLTKIGKAVKNPLERLNQEINLVNSFTLMKQKYSSICINILENKSFNLRALHGKT